jgi:hypothetical protein
LKSPVLPSVVRTDAYSFGTSWAAAAAVKIALAHTSAAA